MKRIAVFVDAGFFHRRLGALLTNAHHSDDRYDRGLVEVNFIALREQLLQELATQFPGVDLLRVYWYDAPPPTIPHSDGSVTIPKPSREHMDLWALDDFKLRLGTLNSQGKQKGVDGLITTDLMSLSQQRVITHALMLAGDADLAPAVQIAQATGVRLHLLALGSMDAVAVILQREADRHHIWPQERLNTFATAVPRFDATREPLRIDGPVVDTDLTSEPDPTQVAQAALAALQSTPERRSLLDGLSRNVQSLPRPLDAWLLQVGRDHYNGTLTAPQMRALRAAFRLLLPVEDATPALAE